jgi:hypothetical protein
MPPFVAERQVELWTSNQIVHFLDVLGYKCLSFPIRQHVEPDIPVDFVFSAPGLVKLFGLQYKVLYQGDPPFWRLDRDQHKQLKLFDWTYYGLSFLTNAADGHHALYALRLTHPFFRYREAVSRPDATALLHPASRNTWWPNDASLMSWWDFFTGLRSCNTGVAVTTQEEMRDLFRVAEDVPLAVQEVARIADYFAVNLDARLAGQATSIPR